MILGILLLPLVFRPDFIATVVVTVVVDPCLNRSGPDYKG